LDVLTLRCNTPSISSLSDSRDKADIMDLPIGLNLINQIKPSLFKWDKREWYENGVSSGTKKSSEWTTGFIAQQLDEVQTNNNVQYLNLVYKSNPDKLEATPGNLLPVIVKSIQDLSLSNENLQKELIQTTEYYKQKIVDLEKRISLLESDR
jgi:hypothetical protein